MKVLRSWLNVATGESGIDEVDIDDSHSEFIQIDAPEVTSSEFLRRFTMQEWMAANALAKADDLMAYGFALFNSASVVRLRHPDTLKFVGYMVEKSIISSGRAAEILAPVP